MKKLRRAPLYFAAAFILALLTVAVLFICPQTKNVSAATNDSYFTHISRYDVTMDVDASRKINITEDITVDFHRNAAMIRDIPVNAGESVKNLSINEITETGELTDVEYNVYYENYEVLRLDIGGDDLKFEEHTYRIKYDYILSSSPEGENTIALAPIGAGNVRTVYDVNVKILLPDGYKDCIAFTQKNGQKIDSFTPESTTENGRTVLTLHVDEIDAGTALRWDLNFNAGVLGYSFDITPYYFVIAIGVLFIIIILIKLLFFNKSILTPVVNFEAPDKMDPLIMGKLIDNKVNSEDITSLIFYWADKGYVKIALPDIKENPGAEPTIIRIAKELPAMSPDYEQAMYKGLFTQGDSVSPSNMAGYFAGTSLRVTKMVNERAKGLYSSMSIGISVIFALLGSIILGLAPLLIGFTVNSALVYFYSFIAVIPALVLYGLCETVAYNKLKNKKSKSILYYCLLGLAVAACAGLYTLLIPNALIPLVPKIILSGLGFAVSAFSVIIVSRTPDYTKKLNDILGFRNFIMLVEKDRLEALIDENPQIYYHVLPYAQVLGVSDKWEDKFKDLTIPPPSWAVNDFYSSYFEFTLINSMIRHSISKINTRLVMKPSSSGLSGGSGSGGRFGGFSGGGHGGGGVSFR